MKHYLTTSLCLLALAGCSSTDTSFLEMAKARGGNNMLVVKNWEKGQEMIEEGEELVEQGKDDISEARALSDKGQERQAQGQRMMQQGERMKMQAESEFRAIQNGAGYAQPQSSPYPANGYAPYRAAPAPYYPQ